ncbi:P2Y purinoceptor 2-like [Alligator sinensis]|uniref:P2Y purinoceptor 2-like n=1 Tax=Alligator sinensis TaxID=38654 RepID=A0A1U7S1Y0_ALLSI|nr:P2Y purinoceptor 2-like [Alligator sinensis]
MENSTQGWRDNITKCQPQQVNIVIPILLSILFLGGLVLNGLSLWIFWFQIRQWNSGMILQFNLALVDSLIIPLAPLMVTYFSRGSHWPFGQFLCQLKVFALSSHLYGSIYFLMLISIHRYFAVVRLNTRSLWKTKPFLKKLCFFFWFILIIQGLPFFFVLKTSVLQGSVRCLNIHQTELSYLYFYYNMIMVVVAFLLPFGISLTCYGLLGGTIAKMSSASLRGKVIKTKSLQMITVSLTIFVICFVPLHICRTMGVIVKFYDMSCELLHQDRLVKAILGTVGEISINHAVPGCESQMHPNIVITHEEAKRVVFMDITIPFENR